MESRTESLASTVILADDSDFAAFFHSHYPRIARTIARVVQDPARAEELAVEVFWRFWRSPGARQSESPLGWLYRTAIRVGLDELRSKQRQTKLQQWFGSRQSPATPEQMHILEQSRQQVRAVLAVLRKRDAALLVLQSEGCSYQEMAEALQLREASVGTLLRRAQQVFRKEFIKRYEKRS